METNPNGYSYDKIFSLIKLLITNNGSIISSNLSECNAISFAYESLNYGFFNCLLESCENLEIFNNDPSRKLIYTIIKKKDWKYLYLLINKSATCEKEDIFILSLANTLLKEKQIELANIVISKCTNRNASFKNGETFLTFIIKENYDESLIIEIIKTKLFDINMKNELKETPLQLANSKSMKNLSKSISNLIVFNDSSYTAQKGQFSSIQHKTTGDHKRNESTNQITQNEASFVSTIIPNQDRIFPEIDINTIVKYYMNSKNNIADLYGKVVWSGKDKHGDYYYGIELEKERENATDGVFEGQKLFQCKPNCGVLAPINKVALDTRVREKEEVVELIKSENSLTMELSKSNKIFDGINFGIQGNIATSLFDSLLVGLFYKSDVLDYLITRAINNNEIDETTAIFREVLAFKIVYPLRKFGYVSYDKIEELKSIFKHYGQRHEESETELNLDTSLMYLSKLWPFEQLLSLISYNNYKSNAMYIQLFGEINDVVNCITSQNMLDMSMINNEIMFNTLPSCLILNVPNNNNEINLIPLKTIDISLVSIIYFKKCKICPKRAIRQCRQCVEKGQYIIQNGFFCKDHECSHDMMQDIPFLALESKSKCYLFLKSIICFDKQKSVAFVKDDLDNRWFRFDNRWSNDKKDTYSTPRIIFSEVLTKFFSQSNKKILKDYDNYSSGSDIRLILRNSSTFIYTNPAMTCY